MGRQSVETVQGRNKTYKNVGQKGPWVIRCAPGLGSVAAVELRFRRVISRDINLVLQRQRNHDLVFIQQCKEAPPGPILRIPEEIHYCLLFGRYKISKSQIERLANVLRAQKQSFRLVVTADGSHFSRFDTQRWLANQLQNLGVPLAEDAENVVWTFCIEEAYYICLPACSFTDSPYRQKRAAERSGALPPTIAAAIAFLGEPKSGETILDPVCGSGTLLAEAYGYAKDESFFIGMDTDSDAINAAKKNLAHIPHCKLIKGDGTQTGLAAESIDLFLANLPFGKQYGDKKTNPQLYGKLLAEMARLGVSSRWRAVLLSSDVEAVESVLESETGLRCEKRLRIKVRGEWAHIFIVRPSKD